MQGYFWLFALFIIRAVLGKYTADGQNVAVYWGQGANQESLATYCQRENFDIVMLSFLVNFTSTDTAVNFGNQCWTQDCPGIAQDIKTCQNLGIKVLLSLGGDRRYSHYEFPTEADAHKAAQNIYDQFGKDGGSSVRPFGDSLVDGFDFDFENGDQTNIAQFAAEIRKLFGNDTLLSAAPQCVYPDGSVQEILQSTDVKLDMVFIQFYNSPSCALVNAGFNSSWETWTDFVHGNKSGNTGMKLYVGFPGVNSSAFSPLPSLLESKIEPYREQSHFGGLMVWDITVSTERADGSSSYISSLNNIITSKENVTIVKRVPSFDQSANQWQVKRHTIIRPSI